LQKPAGLSKAKARSILALATAFQDLDSNQASEVVGDDDVVRVNDEFLTTAEDSLLRETLLKIKGIGPWSCDMFMMFYLERSDILPIGDLGVRKGIAKVFQIRGKGQGGSLCQKKDAQIVEALLEPYRPFQSLISYYMWKAADTKDFYKDNDDANNHSTVAKSPTRQSEGMKKRNATETPEKPAAKKKSRLVTP